MPKFKKYTIVKMKRLHAFKMLTRQLQFNSYSLCKLCDVVCELTGRYLRGVVSESKNVPAFSTTKAVLGVDTVNALQTSNHI